MGIIKFKDSLYRGSISYDRIAYLQEQIAKSKDYIVNLEISDSGRIGLPFVFLIGTLPLFGNTQGKKVRIFASHKLYRLLSRINIVDYYMYKDANKEIDAEGLLKTKAFREIKKASDIITFVNEMNMEVPINITDAQSDILTSRVGEIFQNALEHAKAKIIIGGKYYKNVKNGYCFSCYDSGVGIVNNVKTYIEKTQKVIVSDKEALEWAMKKGHSTRENGNSGGVGLSLLRDFALENGFSIRICSGKVFYSLNGRGKEGISSLDNGFSGTLFEIDIITDRLMTESVL